MEFAGRCYCDDIQYSASSGPHSLTCTYPQIPSNTSPAPSKTGSSGVIEVFFPKDVSIDEGAIR